MKFVGGVILALAGGLAQPVVMSFILPDKMGPTLAASVTGNVVFLAAIGFLLIASDRGSVKP